MNFPTTDAELNSFFLVAVAYILANYERLGVSVANKDLAISRLATWVSSYKSSITPSTSTTITVGEKNVAGEQLKAILRIITGDILNSVLTPTDRSTLRIPVIGGLHAEVPLTESYPVGSVKTDVVLQHTINYRDHESGKKGRPWGVGLCEVFQKVGGTTPTSLNDMKMIGTCTKQPFICTFTAEQANELVYYILRWVSNRSENGPQGPIFTGKIKGA